MGNIPDEFIFYCGKFSLRKQAAAETAGRPAAERNVTVGAPDSDLAFDIVDGESIHAFMGKS